MTPIEGSNPSLSAIGALEDAHLFQEKYAEREEPLRVHTDTLIVSLRCLGEKHARPFAPRIPA